MSSAKQPKCILDLWKIFQKGEVGDEEKGPKDRALGHTYSVWGVVRFERFEQYELSEA